MSRSPSWRGCGPARRCWCTGAAGGVGLTAVELGALMGARVVAVARGAAKRAVAAAAGAALTLDAEDDVAAALKALGGADVVYDTVGGALFDACLRAAKPGARLLPIGFAGGAVPQIPANRLLVKNQTVFGLYFGAWARARPAEARASLETLFAWYRLGRLRPHVGHVLPLAEAERRARAAPQPRRHRQGGGAGRLTIPRRCARRGSRPGARSAASPSASAARGPSPTYMLIR